MLPKASPPNLAVARLAEKQESSRKAGKHLVQLRSLMIVLPVKCTTQSALSAAKKPKCPSSQPAPVLYIARIATRIIPAASALHAAVPAHLVRILIALHATMALISAAYHRLITVASMSLQKNPAARMAAAMVSAAGVTMTTITTTGISISSFLFASYQKLRKELF